MTPTSPKHGFLYISVLVTSLIVIATATTAFSISTSRFRSEQSKGDALRALRAAEAEAHRVASMLSSADLSWRSELASGVTGAWRSGDEGAMLASSLTDSDLDLADDPADLVELTCFASVGRARRGVSCTLQPIPKPLPILDFALVSAGSINVASGGAFACTGKVRCGASVAFLTGAMASANQWHATTAIDPAARGELLVSGQAVAIPDSSLIAAYTALGTQIPAGSLVLSGGSLRLQKIILTASANPFGGMNPAGIYWIDAGGLPVTLSECRIEATLAIINSSQVTLSNANYWRAPIQGGAALVTTAPIRVDQSDAVLRESTASVNFNPSAAPFRGVSDSDLSDRYHSLLEGLVYTPSLFEWTDTNPTRGILLKGTIICGGASIAGPMSMQDDRSSQIDPPLGFRLYDSLQFVHGSWRSVPVPAI